MSEQKNLMDRLLGWAEHFPPDSPEAKDLEAKVSQHASGMKKTESERDTTLPDYPLELRPEVAWFAQQMELQLRANDHKGGWQGHHQESLLDRCREELVELDDAVAICCGMGEVIREAADVANFAMMIADNARHDKYTLKQERVLGSGEAWAKDAPEPDDDQLRAHIAELEAELATAKEVAWDEGRTAGVRETYAAQKHDGNSSFELTPNPHRKEIRR